VISRGQEVSLDGIQSSPFSFEQTKEIKKEAAGSKFQGRLHGEPNISQA